jgi:hypothetical protein
MDYLSLRFDLSWRFSHRSNYLESLNSETRTLLVSFSTEVLVASSVKNNFSSVKNSCMVSR